MLYGGRGWTDDAPGEPENLPAAQAAESLEVDLAGSDSDMAQAGSSAGGDGKERNRDFGTAKTRTRLRSFSKSLPMSLLRAREAVMRHFRASLRRYNMTEQQWRVLRALSDVERIEVTELARATFLLPPSLSRILRDLEERKMITRQSAERDMRRGVISISPSGLALIEKVSPESEAIYRSISREFGEEQLEELQVLLVELERRMNGLQLPAVEREDEAS